MSTIKSSTTLTTAYSVEADTTGALVIQTGATPTTAVTVSSAQVVTLANALPVASGGTGATTSTGSGAVVLATSPTLVTPLLGTPTSGNLANCTFPTLNQNTTGSAATFTSTSQNSQFNSVGVGTAGSTTAGEIRATNNITAFYSSDSRFKENVRDIPDALATVNAIGGKLFDWTDAYIESRGGADDYFVQKADFGVIAQDVQKVFPIAVRTREDGSLAVDYEKLGALAFAALVEITKRVEALEAK
jgi:hypothetical protein